MSRYRKRPVVIVAVQYDGSQTSQKAIVAWTEGAAMQTGNPPHNLVIRTLEGDHLAREGDWIVKGVQGEFYPVKPDIFVQTYEPVDV
jgi:EAL domain-containing protein (putative c-di-GMP-specific phosphodiesterase class I)